MLNRTSKLVQQSAVMLDDETRAAVQDEIGTQSMHDISMFYASLLQTERKRFLWLVFSTMDSDTAISILRSTAVESILQRDMADNQKAWEEVRAAESKLTSERAELERREDLACASAEHNAAVAETYIKKAERLQAEVQEMRTALSETEEELATYKKAVEGMRALKSLL